MTRRIDLIIFPGFQILDAAGPIAAFEIAGRYAPGAYALTVRAQTAGEIASSSGVGMTAAAWDAGGPLDTLMIAGGEGTRAAFRDRFLRERATACAGAARRVASVCTGAFILAGAGLLDNRRATTHWSAVAEFSRLFPRVRLEPDRIWLRDEEIWTSAGITAGIDLSLAMIADDLGDDVARRTAQQLVVYRRRPSGQSQFSALLAMDSGVDRFDAVLAWAREHLAEGLTVERLAEEAAMSPRHFARSFTAAVGVTPAKAVERLRLEVARTAVEDSRRPIDVIAREAGFGDSERMRRAFVRAFGQPPQALRRAAGSSA